MLNVSIVIPAWNEEERINDCLLNATRQTVMPHEVIVVDNRSTDSTVAMVEQFIKDHGLHENFSVQYMADYFSMSASKLSNVYKKKTGNTIMEHVTQIRMAMAEQLLLSEDPVYTVNEIVEKIGYNNTSSFIRKFKSIYGVTPGQYVKAKKV